MPALRAVRHRQERGRFKTLPVELGDDAGRMAVITMKDRQSSAALKFVLNETTAIAKAIAAAE